MKHEKKKLLYLAGTHRCGSTIVDKLLGQLHGFFSAGELQYLWEEAFLFQRSCGCGKPIFQCEVWSRILGEAIGKISHDQVQQYIRLRKQHTRLWMARDFLHDRRPSQGEWGKYLHILAKVYEAIAAVTGCRVIIDSSKYPLYLNFISRVPFLDTYVLHLVRDPRAVAYSMMTPKHNPDPHVPTTMATATLWTSAMLWNIWNPLAEYYGHKLPGRYLLVRYEDFSANPQAALQNILQFLQEDVPFAHLFTDHNSISNVDPTHTIAENPVRFQTGALAIKVDRRWQENMPRKDRILVTILTIPFLLRYGYPFVARNP